jgi:hypothetical protein
MNKSDFFENCIDYFKREGFAFYVPNESFADPEEISLKRQIGFKLAIGVGMALAGYPELGFLMGTNAGLVSDKDKDSLVADLQKIKNYCDFVGIKLSNGPVVLRLGIDGDDISEESMIGRFAIIHERAHDFIKYSASLLKSRFGDNKFSTHTSVVVVFSTHKKAKYFNENLAGKCKHTAFWKKVYTHPWVVDLEDEEIKRHRELDGLFGGNLKKLKSELFRK